MIQQIEIQKRFDFRELEERLRKVHLRGFEHVKIYEKSEISLVSMSPEEIRKNVFTPQPSVYTQELKKVSRLAELFQQQGIDIFSLDGGIDYIAIDEKGEQTEWTLTPPVIETMVLPHFSGRGLDYSIIISPELRRLMRDGGHRQNSELKELNFPEYEQNSHQMIMQICDGSHRIESGIRTGKPQKIIVIKNVCSGFPYYAAPKPYCLVHEEAERIEEKLDKTHILTAPAHKLLYRLFPSGGIKSGTIRPTKQAFL